MKTTNKLRLRWWLSGVAIGGFVGMMLGLSTWVRPVWSRGIPRTSTEFWTMVVALGTLGLAAAAFMGLRSLRLMKRDMRDRALRESRQRALARCEELAKQLIPANGTVLGLFNKLSIPVFVEDPHEVSFELPADPDELRRAEEWVQEHLASNPLYVRSIRFLNDLEVWAGYFVNGVADHNLAYGPCAPVICEMVVQYYAVLVTLRANASSGNYPNLVSLYKAWAAKLEEEKRGLIAGDLLDKLRELHSRRSSQYELDPPIGTELDEDV